MSEVSEVDVKEAWEIVRAFMAATDCGTIGTIPDGEDLRWALAALALNSGNEQIDKAAYAIAAELDAEQGIDYRSVSRLLAILVEALQRQKPASFPAVQSREDLF